MPGKTDLSELNCSLARTLDVVGDWWTLLIIRDAFLGVRRFGDFQRSIGIAKNILANRLEQLTTNGILDRSGPDRRPHYQLTEKGRALLPAIVALMQWGDHWMSHNKPPVIATDAKGHPIAGVTLKSGRDDVTADTVRFRPGPGATPRMRAFFDELAAANGGKAAQPEAGRKGK